MTEEELKKKEEELAQKEKELQEKASATAALDTTKLSDDQILKVLEDPRLWKSERLTKLREKAKKAEELEEKEQQLREEEAKKKGDYEELLKQKDEKLAQLEQSYKDEKINNAIQAAAVKAGAVDPSVVGRLIDRSGIQIGEDGKVSGVDEVITSLLDSSPYLKGNSQTQIGTPSNPSPDTQVQNTFKASQLNDPEFYRKHEKEIDDAMQKGLIEDDVSAPAE